MTLPSRLRYARDHRRGYVLLTTVVMIAVAAMMLARLSSRSMRLASLAMEEERQMRRQWAITSLRRQCLASAETLLSSAHGDAQPAEVANVLWKDIDLAGQKWRVVLSDESAKLNLLHLGVNLPSDRIAAATELLTTGRRPLPISTNIEDAIIARSQRWDHWFSNGVHHSHEGHIFEGAREIAESTQRITLWGDGRLNVTKCDSETLDVLWKTMFGRRAPKKLHGYQGQSPPPTPQQVLGSLALRDSELHTANEWVGTQSNCFSIWVFCLSDHRVEDTLFVEWGANRHIRNRRGYSF